MVAIPHDGGLADDLGLLASALEMLDLQAHDPSGENAVRVRDRLVRSIRSYLMPRLSDTDAPLSVVFAGPTGSGKSTLVNSLSGLKVSETGPVRPTTQGPIVLVSPAHVGGFEKISGVDCEVMTGQARILTRLALIDTPDIDSTYTEHRVAAEILIDNADVVVFVASALRYADMVPWEVLRRARSRGAPVIQVLNRVTSGSAGAMVDFRARLVREGIEADIVRVPEHHLHSGDHRVPQLAVRGLRRRLSAIARDMDDRKREVFERVLDSTTAQVVEFVDSLDAEIAGAVKTRDEVRSLFMMAVGHLDLRGLCHDIVIPDPPAGFWRRWSWRRRHRVSEGEWAETCVRIKRRLSALVEADVRRLVQESVGDGRLTGRMAMDLRTMVAGAADAWLDQLARLAEVGRPSTNRLAGLVLARAAVERAPTGALRLLFEDDSVLVRAYRGLASRLEVIYGEVGGLVAGTLDSALIDAGDTERIREVAETVVARSHFADA